MNKAIRQVSKTMPNNQLALMLDTPGTYFNAGHYQYPANDGERIGNHLDCVFLLDPISASENFVEQIVDDICLWLKAENIEFDLIFYPASPSVKPIVESLAKRTGSRLAGYEYLNSGWFGNKLVEGEVKPGDRVLVFNGVTQQGRCVGARLPQLAQELGGQVVAAAVFAKGTAAGVTQAEEKYGTKFYATIQVPISVNSPQECPVCKLDPAKTLTPWNLLSK
jgi:orotate phosphoribosyltransferase